MERPYIGIYTLLPLCLLVVLVSQLINMSPVSASNNVGAAVFCPNNYDPTVDTPTEITLTRNTLTYIKNLLNSKYGYCHFASDDSCTVNYYLLTLQNLEYIYDQSVVFLKGHRGIPYLYYNPPNTNHFSLLDYYGANVIDNAIYSRTSSENVLTFIWHCQSAPHCNIAMNYSETYSYSLTDGRRISGFNITKDRSTARLVAYPVNSTVLRPYWHVELFLNQTYPGSVVGLTIFVWANSGEVFLCNPIAYGGSADNNLASPSSSTESITGVLAVTIITVAAIIATVYTLFINKKKNVLHPKN